MSIPRNQIFDGHTKQSAVIDKEQRAGGAILTQSITDYRIMAQTGGPTEALRKSFKRMKTNRHNIPLPKLLRTGKQLNKLCRRTESSSAVNTDNLESERPTTAKSYEKAQTSQQTLQTERQATAGRTEHFKDKKDNLLGTIVQFKWPEVPQCMHKTLQAASSTEKAIAKVGDHCT